VLFGCDVKSNEEFGQFR